MKRVLLVLNLILANSLTYAEIGDKAYQIIDPKVPGTTISYSYTSWNCTVKEGCPSGRDFNPQRSDFAGADQFLHEDGVCKSLGYEKALKNSSSYNGGSDYQIRAQVAKNGKIAGVASGVTLSQITCLNKKSQVEEIKEFRLPTSKRRMDFLTLKSWTADEIDHSVRESEEDGVCKYLGYERAAKNSTSQQSYKMVLKGNRTKAIDKDGKATSASGWSGDFFYIIPQIVCMRDIKK